MSSVNTTLRMVCCLFLSLCCSLAKAEYRSLAVVPVAEAREWRQEQAVEATDCPNLLGLSAWGLGTFSVVALALAWPFWAIAALSLGVVLWGIALFLEARWLAANSRTGGFGPNLNGLGLALLGASIILWSILLGLAWIIVGTGLYSAIGIGLLGSAAIWFLLIKIVQS